MKRGGGAVTVASDVILAVAVPVAMPVAMPVPMTMPVPMPMPVAVSVPMTVAVPVAVARVLRFVVVDRNHLDVGGRDGALAFVLLRNLDLPLATDLGDARQLLPEDRDGRALCGGGAVA